MYAQLHKCYRFYFSLGLSRYQISEPCPDKVLLRVIFYEALGRLGTDLDSKSLKINSRTFGKAFSEEKNQRILLEGVENWELLLCMEFVSKRLAIRVKIHSYLY